MNIEIVDGHSVATDLLGKGPVLDAGCRGFVFARYMAERGHPVFMLDSAPDVEPPGYFTDRKPWCHFARVALVGTHRPKKAYLRMTDDPQARHVTHMPKQEDPSIRCETLAVLMRDWWRIDSWDVVKLDIEGSEYDVLEAWPGPIAKQISVEFHEHTVAARGDQAIQAILDHLSRWYKVMVHVKENRHHVGLNWWDTLLVAR